MAYQSLSPVQELLVITPPEYEYTYTSKKSKRDFQRQRVYDAEESIDVYGDLSRRLETMREINAFGDSVIYSRWLRGWMKRNESPQISYIQFDDGRGCKRPIASFKQDGGAVLKFPKWCRTEMVVLHEIAHTLIPYDSVPHGRRWCAAYLELVRRFIGKDEHAMLKNAFKEYKVKYIRRSK